MIAVILAGGEGKRLMPFTADKPKPMIHIGGKPVLAHHFTVLKRYGIRDVYLLTGYKGDVIEKHFNDGKYFGVNIKYLKEDFPLGTAGAVKYLEDRINSDFLLLYGDVLFDLKLDDFIAFHEKKKGAATLVVHPSDHPYDSDLVEIDDKSKITRILNKPHGKEYLGNLGNAAMYILSPVIFKYIPSGKQCDFMKDIFPVMISRAEKLYAYKTAEYIKDMGTFDRLEKVNADFHTGKVHSLSKEFKQPAIFIDRDGTLIKKVELLHKVEDLELFDFSSSAVSKVNQSFYQCILITNQPVVARNLCNIPTLNMIHKKLETLLGEKGVYLDDIFYCPHHPDKGYPEENAAYKIECECRKPRTGMVTKAVKRYNLDVDSSWFIGDSTTDIQTGVNAGMHTILVRTGNGGRDGRYQATPDFVFDNIKEGVEFITEGKKGLDETSMEIIKHLDLRKSFNIITVGGPARSGKTTFIKCLQLCLKQLNVLVNIISLDNWLLGADQRTDLMTVRERYQYKKIGEDITKLLAGDEIKTQIYNPHSRTITKAPPITLNKSGCLIIEGVPALDIESLREMSHVRVYCEVEERVRKKRFVAFYRWKNFSENQIEQLYTKRMNDELPIVKSSNKYADFTIYKDGMKGNRRS